MLFLRILWQVKLRKIMLRALSLQSSRELNDMLKKYESPELEVIELENCDVIVSSDLDGDNGVDPGDWQ